MPLWCTGVETPDWHKGNGRTLRNTRIEPECVTSTRQELRSDSFNNTNGVTEGSGLVTRATFGPRY